MNEVEKIIRELRLNPHPEGGYYRETYRSAGEIGPESLHPDYKGKRNYATCIYFLLTSHTFSAFHRIKQDEIWHFYKGSPVKIHMISDTGAYSNVTLGHDFDTGETPQFVVPGGHWFAAATLNDAGYSLVGCTVSPGFDFTDFELPSRKELVSMFPQHNDLISKFTTEK